MSADPNLETHLSSIFLAGGCFWGAEAYLSRIRGVIKTEVGYANGHTINPTYEEICTNLTGFAETVHVIYNPLVISLKELLTYFFKSIDPTLINKQGDDIGSQYRTGIYTIDSEDFRIAKDELELLKQQYSSKIVTEIEFLENYYPAEEYHQNYLRKNPDGYCHISAELMQNAEKPTDDFT